MKNFKLINGCYVYNRHFNHESEHNRPLIENLTKQLPDGSCLVDSTWIIFREEYNKDIVNFDNVFVFSWYDPSYKGFCKIYKKVEKFLKENNKNVYEIGNYFDEDNLSNYFCYWLYWCNSNLKNFLSDNNQYKLSDNNKAFLCYNRKPTFHRVCFLRLLKENDLLSHGNVTIGDDVYENEEFTELIEASRIINKDIPMRVYVNIDLDSCNAVNSLGNPETWSNSFLNVVTETSIHSNCFISEKTLKPILGLRPFVFVNHFNAYKILQSWDIDLFDKWFGEWYKEENYQKRIRNIIKIIKYVSSLSCESRINLYNKMLPTLISNRENLINKMGSYKI